jgi:superfamily II DNA or RNA helicase
MIDTIMSEDKQLFENIVEFYEKKFNKYKNKGKTYNDCIKKLSKPIIIKDDTIKKEKYIRFSNIILEWIIKDRIFKKNDLIIDIDYNKYLIPHQYDIMILTYNYFLACSKGILNIFCRYGKTRLSCLLCKYSSYKKIVIIVPSLYLIEQTYSTWLDFFDESYIKKISCQDEDILLSDIDTFYKNEYCIFIITYNSSYKLAHLNFDIGIFDEAHRTTGNYNNDKINYKALVENDLVNKKLFMTATMRVFNGEKNKYYSMDDKKIYGNVIASVGINETLKLKRICPYKIITIDIKEEESICIDNFLEDLSDKDRNKIEEVSEKYISIAYGLIRTISKYEIKHIITFHTFIIYCDFFKYILELISSNLNINIDIISGEDNKNIRKDKIDLFQQIKSDKNDKNIKYDKNDKITILCSAKVLQEGVDIPKCDGIIFVDMKSSVVDTIQSFARCLTFLENKEAYIMIPFNEVLDIKNDEYTSNLRHILRTIADVDDNLKEYFKECIKRAHKPPSPPSPKPNPTIFDFNIFDRYNINSQIIENLQEISYLPYEIAKEKVFKKYSSKEEYEINVTNDFNEEVPNNPDKVYKIFGWKNWFDYLGLDNDKVLFDELKLNIKDKDIINSLSYIKYAKKNSLCINPKDKYSKYWTNWYDFLNIDTTNYPQNKDEWKNTCIKYNIKSNNYSLNTTNHNLPLMPEEIYSDFTNLSNELDDFEFDFFQ